MQNDLLGQVDNLHLAISDKYDKLDQSKKNMELKKAAEILVQEHQFAVDFGKRGIPASMKEFQSCKKKFGREWPDFFAEKKCPKYESQKIIGQMHRQIIALID